MSLQTQASEKSIQFRFPAVRSKLQNLFPFDPKSDIQIQYKQYRYELQIAYLRLQSSFFKTINNNITKSIKIQQQFNDEMFQKIMKCFYGGMFNVKLNKNQNCIRYIGEIWKIVNFLKIQHFQKQIIHSLIINWNIFNFFQLLVFGYINNIQQVFNNCLSILDNSNYQQLRQNSLQLLKCPLQVVKFLLNLHNRRQQNKKSLNYIQINNFLRDYCQFHQYSYQFYKQLKFQMIQKTQLNSEQYRVIFIQDNNSTMSNQQNIDKNNLNSNKGQLNELAINTHQSFYPSLSNILLQTNSQSQHWSSKLINLKSSLQHSNNQYHQLTQSVDNLSKIITKKTQQTQQNKQNLIKMQKLLRQIQSQIQSKSQFFNKIRVRVKKLQNTQTIKNNKNNKNKKSIELEKEEQNDLFVQSHIIPGFMLGDMMAQNNNTNFNKIQQNLQRNQKKYQNQHGNNYNTNNSNHNKVKKQQKQKQKQKEEPGDNSYKKSLIFDQQPTCIPKRYLSNLAIILDTDQFVKKKTLNLIYRRSKHSSIGNSSSIRSCNSLLILFQTSSKKYCGGYISIELPHTSSSLSQQYLCDYQSFLFSLTHNLKLPIRKGEQKSAICLSKHYLISFANDLMISEDCINEDSYCEWPSLYNDGKKYSKCQTSKEFVGGSQFRIENLEIYQVKNEEIQMIL